MANIGEEIAKLASDIYRWKPLLDMLASDAGKPRHSDGSGSTYNRTASPVENAETLRLLIATVWDTLEKLAAEAATQHDGEEAAERQKHPALTLYQLATWIARQPNSRDIHATLRDAHSIAARLTGYMPDRSEHACPCCRIDHGQKAPRMEREPTQNGLPDLYRCPRCGYTGIIERAGDWNRHTPTNTLKATWRIRVQEALEASTLKTKPAEAAQLTGVPASTIRTWIQRGKITKHDNGTVSIADVATLSRKETTNERATHHDHRQPDKRS